MSYVYATGMGMASQLSTGLDASGHAVAATATPTASVGRSSGMSIDRAAPTGGARAAAALTRSPAATAATAVAREAREAEATPAWEYEEGATYADPYGAPAPSGTNWPLVLGTVAVLGFLVMRKKG